MNETDYIILRKTPFRESSLIVSGITPEYGRLDFILRGGASIKNKAFHAAGLFRELHVEFKTKGDDFNGLQPAVKTELITNYDSIAENIPGYFAACELSPMLLANTAPLIPIPETYKAVKYFFGAVLRGEKPEPYESLVWLMLLYESGELPPQDGRAGEFLVSLLERVSHGDAMPPNIPQSYWEKLADWRKVVCRNLRK